MQDSIVQWSASHTCGMCDWQFYQRLRKYKGRTNDSLKHSNESQKRNQGQSEKNIRHSSNSAKTKVVNHEETDGEQACKAQKLCFQEKFCCADLHVTHFMWDSSAFTPKRPDSKHFPGSGVTKRQTNQIGKLVLAAAKNRDPRAEATGSARTGKKWTLKGFVH